MAGVSVPTVKIVNHKAKNGYVIINQIDFVIGVHTLWDPEKAAKEKQEAERIVIAPLMEVVETLEENKTPEEIPAELPVVETESVPTQSASPSVSPSISVDESTASASPSEKFEKPKKRVYKRRGRPKTKK